MTEKLENPPLRRLGNPQVQEFILNRHIKPEDFYLIEELLGFPQRLIIMNLHNTFNMLHERAVPDLRNVAQVVKDPESKKLYSLAADFAEKYDWAVAWNLIRILEEI